MSAADLAYPITSDSLRRSDSTFSSYSGIGSKLNGANGSNGYSSISVHKTGSILAGSAPGTPRATALSLARQRSSAGYSESRGGLLRSISSSSAAESISEYGSTTIRTESKSGAHVIRSLREEQARLLFEVEKLKVICDEVAQFENSVTVERESFHRSNSQVVDLRREIEVLIQKEATLEVEWLARLEVEKKNVRLLQEERDTLLVEIDKYKEFRGRFAVLEKELSLERESNRKYSKDITELEEARLSQSRRDQEEITKLRGLLQVDKEKIVRYEEEIRKYKKESVAFKHAQHRIEEFERIVSEQQQASKVTAALVIDLEKQRETLQARIGQLKREIEESRRQESSSQTRIEQLSRTIREIQAKSTADVEVERRRIVVLEEERDTLQEEVDTLQTIRIRLEEVEKELVIERDSSRNAQLYIEKLQKRGPESPRDAHELLKLKGFLEMEKQKVRQLEVDKETLRTEITTLKSLRYRVQELERELETEKRNSRISRERFAELERTHTTVITEYESFQLEARSYKERELEYLHRIEQLERLIKMIRSDLDVEVRTLHVESEHLHDDIVRSSAVEEREFESTQQSSYQSQIISDSQFESSNSFADLEARREINGASDEITRSLQLDGLEN